MILPAEIDIYPEDLLDESAFLQNERAQNGCVHADCAQADCVHSDCAQHDRRWWAVYTKVRQEKRLAAELLAQEIPFYLPMVRRRHVYGGRKRISHIPLFASYLFLFANQQERLKSLATRRIAQLTPVPDDRILFNDLYRIRRLIEADVPLTVEGRLTPGDLVRVRHGCFAGVEGQVVSRCRRTRLIVAITFLQQGVSFEIDDCMLDSIS